MDNTNILSWNTGGLNIPHKRISTLDFLQRRNIDIALLQEVHLLSKDINSLANKYYTVLASSLADIKTKGVAIMVKRSLKYNMLGSWQDDAGRAVMAKIEISGKKIALWSIYAPNTHDKNFYPILLDKMLAHDDC